MDFRAFWEKFRKTVYFRVFYLLLLSALIAFLLNLGAVCIFLLIIPILMVAIPYWFGERSFKNHAINGLVVIPLSALFFSLIFTPALLSQTQEPQSVDCPDNYSPTAPRCYAATGPDVHLARGQVSPFKAAEGAAFNFTVNMTSSSPQTSAMTVRVQMLDFVDLRFDARFIGLARDLREDGNFSNGESFYVETTLPAVFHFGFNFQVVQIVNTTERVVAQTFGNGGPMNASYGTVFGYSFYQAIVGMVIIGFGFYVVLLIYWWTRKAREVRGAAAPPKGKRAEGGGEFTCTNCGADVSEDDAKCPKCGAEFEAEAEGEPAEAT